MEEWEAAKADAGSVVASVDTYVDTDVDHANGELDAEDAAEAADSATGIVRAAAFGAEPEDDVAAAAFGAGDVPKATTGTFVFWRNEYFLISYHVEEDTRSRAPFAQRYTVRRSTIPRNASSS